MNKKIVVVLGLSILISGCLSANKEKNYNFIKGLNEYQKNDKVSALENYKKAYEVDKNNVVLLNEIAYLYVDLGNYEDKVEKSLLNISSNNRFLEEYNESFYTDLASVAGLSDNTIKYSNIIFEKAYKKYSSKNKDIVKIYADFLIDIKEYRKAEDILMKYIVNNEDNLDEYALLKKLYTKENNKQKLENLKKILRNKI